jgi:predicted RNase H-like nuclease
VKFKSVLGVDAAWTLAQPSGVALASDAGGAWRLVAIAPSYVSFYALAEGEPTIAPPQSGSPLVVPRLLASSQKLCGQPVDLVAIDMPLAHGPVTGRRVSDDAVSKAYGARKCGTHTPSALRPGKISDDITAAFGQAGYPLLTDAITAPGLIEVYPHPALVHLAKAPKRLPYKLSRIRSYWPKSTVAERRALLLKEWSPIVTLLDRRIGGVAKALPLPHVDASGAELKAYEDMLDAVVCAWVALCALHGNATPFGDHHSAIWIPNM